MYIVKFSFFVQKASILIKLNYIQAKKNSKCGRVKPRSDIP